MDQTRTRTRFRLARSGSPLRPLARSVERLLALDALERQYHRLPQSSDAADFAASVLEALHIRVKLDARETARLPKTGAALVCSNHPFGAVEGLILARELKRLRPDVKILVNSMLERIPELRDLFLPVDLFAEDALQANARALRAAIAHLRAGGMLAIFPAGEVSSLKLRERRVVDPRWSDSIARMALRAGAKVCPAFFAGRNGTLFQLAGLVHPRLRTALLPRELLNKRGRELELRFGTPIEVRELEDLPDDRTRTDYLRLRTYALGDRTHAQGDRMRRSLPDAPRRLYTKRSAPPGHAPLARAEDPAVLAAEFAALPSRQLLAAQGHLQVWLAAAHEIPVGLLELGRLREETFRAAGEGTGQARDIDRHDSDYLHLILWDAAAKRIAGAYRMGGTDRLLRNGGLEGLYTASLFRYDRRVLSSLSPALELGRSFVALDYQKSYAPLLLLWKGIGAYLVANPRYRRLFGPVSISASYSPLSRQIIAQYLQKHRAHAESGVSARNALQLRRVQGHSPQRLAELLGGRLDLSALVSDLEPDKKGVPVLLREYLRLGGKVLALNVDPDFSDALDALLVVDLLETEERLLERYFGAEGLRGFLVWHGRQAADPAA